MTRTLNFLAYCAATITVVLVIIGALALLCRVFEPWLDAFDRGEGPLCCNVCVAVALIVPTALAWMKRE